MKKVLIIGAGKAGRDILREVKKDPSLGLSVMGFIDDDSTKLGKDVVGIKVLGSREKLKEIVKKKKIKEVIIAIPSAYGEQIAEYVKICAEARIDFRVVPRVKEIIEGKAQVKTLRKVQVEDLLGRPVVKADVRELKAFFKGRQVLVTGAAGSIGSELSQQIAAYRPKLLVLLDWWENGIFDLQLRLRRNFPRLKMAFIIGDIKDRSKMRRLMKIYRPDFVYHTAAYKHVPLMEENPEEAVKNNIFGTLALAKEAVANGVKRFVLVSTDKAANPVNVMGATKLITEGIAKTLNGKTKFMVVRFGNVLDSFASVVPIFRKQIEEGGPLTITDKNMTRYFMTIPEAAQLILKAGFMGKGGELFVLDIGKPVKILDLAENMIRLSSLIPGKDIKIVFTGKRQGEKINEQLLTKEEALRATKERGIYTTKTLGLNLKLLPKTLKRLQKYAEDGKKDKIREELKKLIKDF